MTTYDSIASEYNSSITKYLKGHPGPFYYAAMRRISNYPYSSAGQLKYFAAFNRALYDAKRGHMKNAETALRELLDDMSDREELKTKGSTMFNLDGKATALLGKVLLRQNKVQGAALIAEAVVNHENKTALRDWANILFFGKYGIPQDRKAAIEAAEKSVALGNECAVDDLRKYRLYLEAECFPKVHEI